MTAWTTPTAPPSSPPGRSTARWSGEGDDLRTWLRKSFFGYHRELYENRPIYFPLSSSKRSYVAFVSIHRWQDDTLQTLLAEHLVPELRKPSTARSPTSTRCELAPTGPRATRPRNGTPTSSGSGPSSTSSITLTSALAAKGPPSVDDKHPKREADAPFTMDLDDGVMVNAAALWPLLETQWKDPRKWWKELCTADGKKDYDWAHSRGSVLPKARG